MATVDLYPTNDFNIQTWGKYGGLTNRGTIISNDGGTSYFYAAGDVGSLYFGCTVDSLPADTLSFTSCYHTIVSGRTNADVGSYSPYWTRGTPTYLTGQSFGVSWSSQNGDSHGSGWSISDFNSTYFGVRKNGGGNASYEGQITQMYIHATYVPMAGCWVSFKAMIGAGLLLGDLTKIALDLMRRRVVYSRLDMENIMREIRNAGRAYAFPA